MGREGRHGQPGARSNRDYSRGDHSGEHDYDYDHGSPSNDRTPHYHHPGSCGPHNLNDHRATTANVDASRPDT